MAQPKFVPKPGQVDYTTIRYAPTINIVVTYKGKVFVVQRAADLDLYPGYWDWVCGFLDDNKSIEDKALEELQEELGLVKSQVKSITRGEPWIYEAPQYKKTWLIVPVLAEVTTDKFTLDWEAQRGQWLAPKELKKLTFPSGGLKTAAQFFPELN